MPTDFETIDKVIRTYIKYVLKTDEKINEFVPNTHIAETFKDVLIYSELESKNEDTFHNVKHNPYDSIGTNNPDDYDKLEDGRYVKKETYSVGINHILIPEYFDLKRLKTDGVNEIHRTYQKLREKRDIVRNNILLGGIVLRDYTHRPLAKSYNLKTIKPSTKMTLNTTQIPESCLASVSGSTFVNADCFDVFPFIEDNSIDAIICDLPYGTTACKWDSVLPLDKLWKEYNRVLKEDGNVILFSAQPFTSFLLVSNVKNFRYDLVWKKNTGVGFNTAKWQPLRYHESILVFSKIKKSKYNPIPTERFSEQSKNACKKPIQGGGRSNTTGINMGKVIVQYDSETKNPESVLEFKSVPNGGGGKLHSTQKPLELMEYLVKTYTNEGDTVLDNTMGSGTTNLACIKLNRKSIGIEKEKQYYDVAVRRASEYCH